MDSTGQQNPVRDDSVQVSRVMFNYVAIAIVFFLLGGFMGSFLFPAQAGNGITTVSMEAPQDMEALVRAAMEDVLVENGLIREPGLVQGERYEAIAIAEEEPFWGPADAPITVIEFSDFMCGFCGRFASQTLTELQAEYGDQVKFVYMDFPFLSPMSIPTALAGQCAHDQGQFWPMHDALFANQSEMSEETILVLAEEIGLDMDTFNTCFEERVHVDEIAGDYQIGSEMGVTGTPAFFINGRFVSGAQPIEVFRTFIDEELESVNEAT